jgi:quinolinate synthase
MRDEIQNNIKNTIKRLAGNKRAIILAHNYQPPEIQDIADLCGDSLELSIRAAQTDAAIIVFCGVRFMAETAAILSPDKNVLLPKADAGCPMADMITPEALKEWIRQHPGMPVVTYVNSTAAVKALTTVCCTSANVVKVVNSLAEDEILMAPDRNLANYAAAQTSKRIHIWNGCCPFHDALTPEDVLRQQQRYPEALFMAHPECRKEVLDLADVVTSTSGMLRVASESKRRAFIVGTEVGLLYPLQKANPDKLFYPASEALECRDMKKITLEDVAESLKHLTGQVKVPEDIRIPALQSVERMIEL